MEVHAFKTDGVEYMLNDILSSFTAFTFALNGLMNLKLINNDQFAGLEYIIRDAHKKAETLIKALSPVLCNGDERIVLLFGEQSDVPGGNHEFEEEEIPVPEMKADSPGCM